MSQVSKRFLQKEIYKQIFDVFIQTIVGLDTTKSASSFLEEFLSPTEKIMFVKRLAIGILIAKECDYREIARTLKVSTATVAVYNFTYKYGDEYKKVIDQILRDKKIEKFFLEFIKSASSIAAIGGAKSSGWFEIKEKLRKKERNSIF